MPCVYCLKTTKGLEIVKTRPLNGPGMNTNLSNVLSDIFEPIANNMPDSWEQCSTESVLGIFDKHNKLVDTELAAVNCKEILEDLVDEIWGTQNAEDEVFSEPGTEPEYQKPVGSEVITGFDVVALFPSIEKDLAVKICKEVLMETEVKLMDTNLLEATRFLALTMSKKEIEKSPLKGFLPKRRKLAGKKTGKLGLTTANSLAPGVNDMTQWVWNNS